MSSGTNLQYVVDDLHQTENRWYIKMSVDKFGRMPQSRITYIDGVSATHVNNTFIKRDVTNTENGSINMTGNNQTNASDPVHNHDVATKNCEDSNLNSVSAGEGPLSMRNHRIKNLGMPPNPEHAVKKRYADSHSCTLYDNLNMDGNGIMNVRNPSSPQDVTTKIYVDIHKPIIAVCAEQNGSMTEGNFKWACGNGSSGSDHNPVGFPMARWRRIIKGKISETAGENFVRVSSSDWWGQKGGYPIGQQTSTYNVP